MKLKQSVLTRHWFIGQNVCRNNKIANAADNKLIAQIKWALENDWDGRAFDSEEEALDVIDSWCERHNIPREKVWVYPI
jgi:hypothetical protein